MPYRVYGGRTTDYDRGDKFTFYRTIPSLMPYVLIDQDSIAIEHFRRQPDGTWLPRGLRSGEGLTLRTHS
jgi:Uma2 family endonuclease